MSKPIWESENLPADPTKLKYRSELTKGFRLYCMATKLGNYTAWLTRYDPEKPELERTVWQPAAFVEENDELAKDRSAMLLFEYLFEKRDIVELLLQKTGQLGGVKLCQALAKKGVPASV